MADVKVKKPNRFIKMLSGIASFFKETKSEVKKIVWPTKKQALNNTLIVVGVLLAVTVFVCVVSFGFDSGVNWIMSFSQK